MENTAPTSGTALQPKPEIAGQSSAATPVFLLLTANQWLLALAVGVGGALLLYRLYWPISPWVGVSLFLTGTVIVHMRYATRYILPLPHIALLIAALQYVFAAWMSVRYPPSNPVYDIGSRLPEYLMFASLILLAAAVAWVIALFSLQPPAAQSEIAVTPQLLQSLDFLLVLGFLGVFADRYVQGTSLSFVVLLVSNLRYIAVFGRMLCRVRGWGWRLALVIGMEILYASSSTMFHGLILWLSWSFALWLFVSKPSWRVVLAACIAGLLLLPALQRSKAQLREQLFGKDEQAVAQDVRISSVDKAELWVTLLGSSLMQTITGDLEEDFVSEMLVRYNQGWIVDRVMQHVPVMEPFARGGTLKNAVFAALVPRAYFPDKLVAGGKAQMLQYAGMDLGEQTSMNLGYAGEMYANFGYWGGIAGCAAYWLVLGLLFRMACNRAFISPMWWCIVPYVGFSALKAEDDIAGVLNWTGKACVVLFAVCLAFPAFRHALIPPRESDSSRPQHRRLRRKTVRVAKTSRAIISMKGQ